ncbi:MAG: PAS domain S-box protein, partial [Verrucomicrobiia bacterium]
MTTRQHKTVVYAVIPFLAAGGVVLDFFMPLGVADWVWYFVPLLLSIYVGGRSLPYVLAAVLSLLTLVGFFLSPSGIDPHLALMSRLMGICVLWLMAFVICQRKRAEEEAHKLLLATEHSPASIVITDRAGNIEYVNSKFMALTGYSSKEVIGKNPRILKSGETPPGEYKQMWETITAGREWRGKFHNRKKNGELYWEQASIAPIFDSTGNITHFLAIKEDITERKQAEETLATEQRLLNSLITAMPDVIYFKDRECRFIRINAAFVRKHGLPETRAVLGKTDFDMFGEQHARQAYEDEQRIIATGEPLINQEEREDWRDGRVTWVSSTKMPLRDDTGKTVGIMGISRDITGRKQAEQELAETLDFNQKIISNAPVGMVVFKASGRCVLANEAAGRTLNATVSQLLNQDFRQIESWRVSGMLKIAEETLATRSPRHGEFHFTSTFGKEAWLACHFSFFVRGNEPHLLLLFNDIIERKRADEALANERALLRTLVDHLPLAVYLKDIAGRKTLANRLELEYLGATSEAEVLGKTDFDFYPPELASVYQAFDQEMIRTGQPLINHEGSFTKPDGSVINLLASVVPLRDATGRVTGLVGINLDITERKRAEEALQESQALYYSFVEHLPIGVFRKDCEGRFVLVNRLFCQMKGMKAEEFLGKTPQEVAAAEVARQGAMGPAIKYAAIGVEHHERIMQTGKPIELVEEYVRTDGSKQLLHTMKWPVFGPDGKIVGTQGIQLDITELKQAEEHVREQAALLDKAQDAIMVLDLDDRITFWNKGAEQIYGWSAVEATGKRPVDLFLGGEVSPRHAEARKVIKERGEWSGELQEVTKQGQAVTVQGRCNVICDEQGHPKGRLIINTDVTERKKLEAQFLRTQRVESLGTLAGGIAHDLNNVLTPLLFAVQVLKEKITDGDGKRLLESLEANVQRGASLVKQVLAFGRGVEGERIVVQPKHIAREIKQMINETFPKSVAFELRTAPDLWTVTGDPTQLHQILLNLCVNARDAMPNGGKLS